MDSLVGSAQELDFHIFWDALIWIAAVNKMLVDLPNWILMNLTFFLTSSFAYATRISHETLVEKQNTVKDLW